LCNSYKTECLDVLAIGHQLAEEFAKTAAERDRNGSSPPTHEIEQVAPKMNLAQRR
jgi:hypothetical protein